MNWLARTGNPNATASLSIEKLETENSIIEHRLTD